MREEIYHEPHEKSQLEKYLEYQKWMMCDMKKDWEVKKLGEMCDILDSLRKPITKCNRVEGDFPYYGATGILSYINDYIFSEKLILIGKDGAKWGSGDNTAFIVNGKYGVNNHAIEITEREEKRVKIFLSEADQSEKAIVFCANQGHAALIRDLINQNAENKDPFYCVRVTANDGKEGEQSLENFQDNERTLPTILTTSQKLSTGVDARNIRNIVLFRPVNSMIEFKQIIGRGTRLFDGKKFFTIYDFTDAYKNFSDPEWNGEPIEPEGTNEQPPSYETKDQKTQTEPKTEREPKQKIKVKLRDGKEREIQYMISTSFWNADGKPISAQEFLSALFGELPKLFKDEENLRKLWSNPQTRKTLLEKLEEAGFPKSDLLTLQKLVNMEKSDLYDVLEYVFNGDYVSMTREARAKAAEADIFAPLNDKEKEFISFVLAKYIETGVDELDQEKLPILLANKYQSLEDAKEILGNTANISRLFIEFQKHLYKQKAA